MNIQAAYPTPEHERAAIAACEFFVARPETEAVLLVNSCARGLATPDSCLDLAVLVPPGILAQQQLELAESWQHFYTTDVSFKNLRNSGRFSVVHFDYIDGSYAPTIWDDGGGPDGFELEIGNQLAYSVAMWERGDRLARLKAKWLPYYTDTLRRERLRMVKAACVYDLDHIEAYIARGLYFAAFDRLYKALQEFLQALFISRGVYPVAYNKWIREGVEGLLGMPELYNQLPPLLQISAIESSELAQKAETLRGLVLAL